MGCAPKEPNGGSVPKPPSQHWNQPTTTAPCSRPSWRPGVPFRDLVLPTGRRIRFTANFAVITVVLQFAAEEGIAADALANIDIADVRLIPTMLRPDRAEEILARGGMALQPDENWRMVLAQLDTDSFTEFGGLVADRRRGRTERVGRHRRG